MKADDKAKIEALLGAQGAELQAAQHSLHRAAQAELQTLRQELAQQVSSRPTSTASNISGGAHSRP